MKGFKKGVKFCTSADHHFAQGGAVKEKPFKQDIRAAAKATKSAPKQTRPASDYKPGANREANIRDGFAPDLPKAARDEIERRFKPEPIKKARGGGILGQVAAKIAPAAGSAVRSAPKPAANARAVPGVNRKPMFGKIL